MICEDCVTYKIFDQYDDGQHLATFFGQSPKSCLPLEN